MYLWRTTYESNSRHSHYWNRNDSFYRCSNVQPTTLIHPPQYKYLRFHDTIMEIFATLALIGSAVFGAYKLTPKTK